MSSHAALTSRLGEIARHFLPDPLDPLGAYDVRQQDHIAAYVVMVHAEIEAFCEALVRSAAQKAFAEYDATGKMSFVLWSLIVEDLLNNETRAPQEVDDSMVRNSVTNFFARLSKSHGIKETNIVVMFRSIGIRKADIDSLWLVEMSAFGTDRGQIAHNATASAIAILDPVLQANRVKNVLLPELLNLENKVAAL